MLVNFSLSIELSWRVFRRNHRFDLVDDVTFVSSLWLPCTFRQLELRDYRRRLPLDFTTPGYTFVGDFHHSQLHQVEAVHERSV